MSKYALVENGVVVQLRDFLPKTFKNVSGFDLLEVESRNKYGWYDIVHLSDDHNKDTQYISGVTHYFENNNVYCKYIILEKPLPEPAPQIVLSEEELAIKREQEKADILQNLRASRNDLLAKSDWTQLADMQQMKSEAWKNAWKTYRQALRDLPEEYMITNELIWPEIPTEE